MRVEWIEHKGAKVLFADYSEIKDQNELLKLLGEFHKIIEKSQTKVFTLSDVTNASVGPDFMGEVKRLGIVHADKRNKSAILGVTGLKGLLLKGYNASTKSENPTAHFESKEEALDYLIS